MGELVKYEAQDGTSVELTPRKVIEEIVPAKYRNALDDRNVSVLMAKLSARRMNPLAGDCSITVLKGVPTVMPSIDYYRRVAASEPGFDGVEKGVIVRSRESGKVERVQGAYYDDDRWQLVGGWCRAYDKGRSRPSVSEVSLAEYDQHNSMWDAKPATMIQKVAESQALRELYPGMFGGTYTSEELPDGDPRTAPRPAEQVRVEVPDFDFGGGEDVQDAEPEQEEDAPEGADE